MTVHLCTFATDDMSRSRELCYLSAMKNGVERADLFGPESVRRLPHYVNCRAIFDAPKGAGYWAWKPALLNQIMNEDAFVQDVRENDVIVYADAGVEFIAPVSHIIERMDQDIFLFGNNWEHAHWCKRDVIEEMWPGAASSDLVTPSDHVDSGNLHTRATAWSAFDKQVQASVIFFRVSDYTRHFVKEWLDWCLFEGGRLIDDSPSRLPNHPEFQEHRHDQAILTTMAYREGCPLHYWPAMYNDGAFSYEKLSCYAGDDYPILFHHHRRRDHEWA